MMHHFLLLGQNGPALVQQTTANTAAIESVKADACVDLLMRQNKYLNNIVEQDYRGVKRVTQPILGLKSF